MEDKHIEFFEDLPKHVLLIIQEISGNKFKELDTYTLSCIFCEGLVLRKSVTDNLKECANKIVAQRLKHTPSSMCEIRDIELTKECQHFVDNYLYFKHRYDASSELMTTFISYELVCNNNLESYKFFSDCLYEKEKVTLPNKLFQDICSAIGVDRSELLQDFGEYLTDPIYETKYSCYGREKEILKSINILCRYNKSNVLLVGKTGVGKTSVVYGICNYLQSKQCPECLKGFEVFSLDTNKLVSGTTYRGDLEERLEMVCSEIKAHTKTIVFLDEMQTIFAKTSSENEGATLANVLKPILLQGAKFIGCTTDVGYKAIESDSAFERRFSVVNICEPNEQQTVQYLMNTKKNYEGFHDVYICDTDIQYIVKRCHEYIKNRNFPDKAFDCLDIACSNCKMDNRNILSQEDMDNSIYTLTNINGDNFNIRSVSKVEEEIKNIIFGQDEAIKSVCDNMRRYFLGVHNKSKPIGTFLFVGPTGTGKTELCKQLAKKFFTEESFIRFDMSEFMEPHSVSKLIGAPPGYVGFANKGKLTESVKHNPFSIILFDEIEKAHKDVINTLLQIMDDGRLTDSFGTSVNFCNCLIIMTSNLGCKEYLEKNSIGFGNQQDSTVIKKSVDNYFSPEFRNRIDKIVYFNPITKDVYDRIFDKEINEFVSRYRDNGIVIEIDDEAYNALKNVCFDDKNGVRFVQRRIAKDLEEVIMKYFTEDKTVYEVTYDNGFKLK